MIIHVKFDTDYIFYVPAICTSLYKVISIYKRAEQWQWQNIDLCICSAADSHPTTEAWYRLRGRTTSGFTTNSSLKWVGHCDEKIYKLVLNSCLPSNIKYSSFRIILRTWCVFRLFLSSWSKPSTCIIDLIPTRLFRDAPECGGASGLQSAWKITSPLCLLSSTGYP